MSVVFLLNYVATVSFFTSARLDDLKVCVIHLTIFQSLNNRIRVDHVCCQIILANKFVYNKSYVELRRVTGNFAICSTLDPFTPRPHLAERNF